MPKHGNNIGLRRFPPEYGTERLTFFGGSGLVRDENTAPVTQDILYTRQTNIDLFTIQI